MIFKYSGKLKYLLVLVGIMSVITGISCQENENKIEIQELYKLDEQSIIKQFTKLLDNLNGQIKCNSNDEEKISKASTNFTMDMYKIIIELVNYISKVNKNSQNSFDGTIKYKFEMCWNKALTRYGYHNVSYLKNIVRKYNINLDSISKIIGRFNITNINDSIKLVNSFVEKLNNFNNELQELKQKNFMKNMYNKFTQKSEDKICKSFANDIYVEVRKFMLHNILYNVKDRKEWQKYFYGNARYLIECIWYIALQKYGENNVSNLKSKLNKFKINSITKIMQSVEYDNIRSGFGVIFNSFCNNIKLLGNRSYNKMEFKSLFYEEYNLLVNNLCNFINETKYVGEFSGSPNIGITSDFVIENIWSDILKENNDKLNEDIITVLRKYKMEEDERLFNDFNHIMLHYKIFPSINEILHRFTSDINKLNENNDKTNPAMYLEKYGLMWKSLNEFKQQMKYDIVNFSIPSYYNNEFIQQMKNRNIIFEIPKPFYDYDLSNVILSKYSNLIGQAYKYSNIDNIKDKFEEIAGDFLRKFELITNDNNHINFKEKYDQFITELFNFMESKGYYIDSDKLSNPKYYILDIIFHNSVKKIINEVNNIYLVLESNGIKNISKLLEFYNIIYYYKLRKILDKFSLDINNINKIENNNKYKYYVEKYNSFKEEIRKFMQQVKNSDAQNYNSNIKFIKYVWKKMLTRKHFNALKNIFETLLV